MLYTYIFIRLKNLNMNEYNFPSKIYSSLNNLYINMLQLIFFYILKWKYCFNKNERFLIRILKHNELILNEL